LDRAHPPHGCSTSIGPMRWWIAQQYPQCILVDCPEPNILINKYGKFKNGEKILADSGSIFLFLF